MKSPVAVLITLLFCLKVQAADSTSIRWDSYGVPHISAGSDAGAFYAMGWAQMKAHANVILRIYAGARGRSAEYFSGESHVQNDLLVRKLAIPKRSQEWFQAQDEGMKTILRSFADGMNDFCSRNPGEISAENIAVLPVKPEDALSALQLNYHVMVAGFDIFRQSAEWKSAGSNAWAIAPKKSASGNAMLLIQPHPPWAESFLFFEAHITAPGLNFYGIAMAGTPVMAMGFNQHLGWALTFNQADASDLIQLEVDEDTYKINHKPENFSVTYDTILVKQDNGYKRIAVPCKESRFGYILEEKEDYALALRISGLERPGMLRQFYMMCKSGSQSQFMETVSMMQLPLQNIIYSDAGGNIALVYNGLIPQRPGGSYADWAGIIPPEEEGSMVSAYIPWENLPKLINPSSGFIANSNNSPFTSTFPFVKNTWGFPEYAYPGEYIPFDFRAARSLRMITEKDKLSFEDVAAMQASTHAELADRVLPELITYAKESGEDILMQAAGLLESWDRSTSPQSKGSVIFGAWYFAARRGEMFQTPFDPARPLETPAQLTKDALKQLLPAVKRLAERYGSIDLAWGDIYKSSFNGTTAAGGPGLGELGSFNAGFYSRDDKNIFNLAGGTAFSCVVEFADTIKAAGLLSYSNATQPGFPISTNQLELLIQGKLRPVLFSEWEVQEGTRLLEKLILPPH